MSVSLYMSVSAHTVTEETDVFLNKDVTSCSFNLVRAKSYQLSVRWAFAAPLEETRA